MQAEALLASVKSSGMAGTAIAYPLDAACIAYNPAGILWVGDRLDLGFFWEHDTGSSHVSNNLFPTANGTFNGMKHDDFYFGDFAATKTFCCECFNWAIGVAVYDRDYQKTRFDKVQPLFGRTRQGLEYALVTVAPTIAIQFCECHTLGVSIDYQTERFKVEGLQTFNDFTLHPGKVTNNGHSHAHGWTATIGWRSQICDWLAFGAIYQPKTHMSKFSKYTGFLVHGRIDVPERAGAGIAIYPVCCLAVCFDAEWTRWSQIKSLSNNLLHDNTLYFLGTEHGPGAGFRDQWSYRVGVEYCLNDCWTVRAGFRHANTPTRSSQAPVNALILDLVQNYVTVGATWQYNCCNEFSGFFSYGFQHRLEGDNTIPLIPFGGGNITLKERQYVAGISWGWIF